jgi:hypothetical protein
MPPERAFAFAVGEYALGDRFPTSAQAALEIVHEAAVDGDARLGDGGRS